MKKFFIILSACLLIGSYILIPADAPVEKVREWLAYEVFSLAVLYLLFHSLDSKSNR